MCSSSLQPQLGLSATCPRMEIQASLYLSWTLAGMFFLFFLFFLSIYAHIPSAQDKCDTSKPYQAPAIIEGLREVFFSGPKSYVSKHLKWMIVKRGQKQVFEVSKAMVALVAAGVGVCFPLLPPVSHYFLQIHSVLSNWESGRPKRSNFLAHLAQPVYLKHIKLLTRIETKRKKFYACLMVKLFQLARFYYLAILSFLVLIISQ